MFINSYECKSTRKKMIYNLINRSKTKILPKTSEVLNCYLKQENYPYWTAYFVKYKDVVNDQFHLTCFLNKTENNSTYLVLRTGCFPFIKYHCSKLDDKNMVDIEYIKFQNKFFNFIKLINFGIAKILKGEMSNIYSKLFSLL